ncbi:MAG TPA: tRNA (adenosine(37)-N6)-threonylcarbamoyltransferase complex dimerization subunit type 1 TsaB [Longilinea sp.]|nr:tRNA (adenosine(37)-N6)-threonylcarbamoyltransferase complex dimerization subunit type 1 TsaB [Longilinea sp.]
MLLAIDTSTQWMGLALFDGSQVIGEMVWQTHNHHTVELAPAIDSLFKRSGILPERLKALAVALGPGSFTSLRIGLAVAKGLALAQHLPVVGVPTLDFLVAAQPLEDVALAGVLQAGRGRLAVGWYSPGENGWQADGDAKLCTAQDLAQEIRKPTLICGELSADDRQVLGRKWKNVRLASPAQSLRRPSYLAEIAWKRYQDNQVDDVITLSPIYLHVTEDIPG